MSDISKQLDAIRVQAGDELYTISRENARVEVLADIHAHLERIEAVLCEHLAEEEDDAYPDLDRDK